MSNPVREFENALLSERLVDRFATVYHSSPGERSKYLREHPNADPSKHQVSTKHKPKARPQREREYAVGRGQSQVDKIKRNLDEDTKALDSAKDDKERGEIQRDIDSGKKRLEEAQGALDKATKGRDEKKRKPKEASVVVAFEEALAVRFAMEHDSPEALKKYLQEHPGADKSNHTVKKKDAPKGKSETFEPSKEHKALGGELQQWHGPGTPAINEVGSHLTGGKAFPRKKIEQAARELEKMIEDPRSSESDKDDLQKLVMKLWRMDH